MFEWKKNRKNTAELRFNYVTVRRKLRIFASVLIYLERIKSFWEFQFKLFKQYVYDLFGNTIKFKKK